MPVTVHLHASFVNGKLDSELFRDMPHMALHEMQLLVSFLTNCIQGRSLPGRNKRSWVDGNGVALPYNEGYKVNNVWHYHAGPHNPLGKNRTSNIRIENLGPETSDAVIHYTWRGRLQRELIVLGFSPRHKPFPKYDSKRNAVRNRVRLEYPDDILVDGSMLLGV